MLANYYIKRSTRASSGLSPVFLAQLYGAKSITPKFTPKIALVELGGGYDPNAIASWCQQNGVANPILSAISIDGATNAYTGNPQSADVEVELDICCAAGWYYALTGRPAVIDVLFAPNSDTGFIDSFVYLVGRNYASCGVSWGAAEDGWAAASVQGMSNVLAKVAAGNCWVCCAAGDSGSGDGESGNHADFPGSDPSVICCGGTSLVVNNNSIANESVWNVGGGASGGGYSSIFQIPAFQKGFVTSGSNRGVPDLSFLADPNPGWSTPFGAVGGTSAVAPAFAGFLAAVAAANGGLLPNVQATLYNSEPTGFRDIVAGNDGSFSAGKGWDAASGLGAPILSALTNVFLGGATPTPVPTPPPTPTPVPVPPPVPSPPVVTEPTEQDVIHTVDASFAYVEGRVPGYYKRLLQVTNQFVDANLKQLYASQALHISLEKLTKE